MVDKHMLDGFIINADVDKSDIERLRLISAVSFQCEMGEGIPLVASDHIKRWLTGSKTALSMWM